MPSAKCWAPTTRRIHSALTSRYRSRTGPPREIMTAPSVGKKLAQAQIDATAQQIALDVRNAMIMVEMNKAHIESAGKARELAQSTLDAEQKKYDLGISTLFFVLQAQTNLAIAQTNEIQALVSYTKLLVALDRATGETLFHNHIEIEQAKPRIAVNAAD